MDRNPLRPQPVPLDAKEQIVIKHLRSVVDYGCGDLTVQVRNNGEIVMIKKETHDIVAPQRRRD